MKRKIIFFFIAFAMSVQLKAQPWFQRVDTIPVEVSGNWIDNPWAGGLNFCEFSEIDLNFDGIKDLFVFDRTGNKITTFLNGGTPNTVDYKHAPQYQNRFPNLHDWALLADYNCDGKEDVFSYSDLLGAINIYKNISDTVNGIQFVLVTQRIISEVSSIPFFIQINGFDIPAIADVDSDGDLDILLFSTSNAVYVEYHKNMSIELYGNCDSLKYELKNSCWGYFSEDFSSNSLHLQDTCSGNVPNPEFMAAHSGSCLLCLDLDGDIDKDLLIGDISFMNIVSAINGGTLTSAGIDSTDSLFPSNTQSVNLTISPCSFYLDVDNDGKKDLLVSPSAKNASENFASVWWYKNTGTASAPVFTFQQNNFLQNQMIENGSGAYPAFLDYNADGLTDLLISNFGYFGTPYKSKIALYENIGTASAPQFKLITRDFNSISNYSISNMVPAFGDMDGDGDADMIIGDYSGKLHYFNNTAGAGNPVNFVLSQANYFGIDIGTYAFPQIIDVNRDGKLDLLVGEREGILNYYVNTGTIAVPVFSATGVTNFGGVDVMISCCTGYSYPFLFDSAGTYKLFVGSEKGYIYYYTNIDGNLTGNFTLVDSMYLNIYEGESIAINGADINNDGLFDLAVGNFAGGVSLYFGTATNPVSINENYFGGNADVLELYPNPASSRLTIVVKQQSKKSDIKIFNLYGQTLYSSVMTNNTPLTLDISVFPSGLYIVQCASREIFTYGKFIVNK